jgi:RND family efflux transporter MFP subunit
VNGLAFRAAWRIPDFFTTLLGLLAIASATGVSAAQGPPPTSVRVDGARLEQVQMRRMVTGELRPVRRALVATEEPGIVAEVAVEQGQVVKTGQLLARLNDERLAIEVRDAEAQELAAQALAEERGAELQWRQHDLEMYQSLTERAASNAKELYDAQAQTAMAKAKLNAAERMIVASKARSDLLKKRMNDMQIKAPFDGIVVAKHAEIGEWLQEGDQVVELVSSGPIEAWLDVPQQYADAIIGKQPNVTVNVEPLNASLESANVRIVPLVDSKARSFSVIIRLENEKGLLAPGMSINGWVPTAERGEEITISKNAVMRNELGPFVYVAKPVAPQGPASAIPVQVNLLFSLKDRYVIRAGPIAAGDLLIVEGNERLFPTAPVMPIQDGAPAPHDGSAN